MTTNEIFRFVDPETGIERVISFDAKKEIFYFHRDGDTEPTASYGLSPEDIKKMVSVFEKTHSGAELLRKNTIVLLEEKFLEFAMNRPWSDIHRLRDAIQIFFEFQRQITPVPA
jgi:hypothetical protein